jgi:hypothetical protein
MYGPDDTDFVRHQWYGIPGTALSNGGFSARVTRDEFLTLREEKCHR